MLYTNNNRHQATYNPNISQTSQQQQQNSCSQCSQCNRNTYNIQQESQQEESSLQVPQRRQHHSNESSSEGDVSAPLRKNIGARNYQFDEVLKLMQYEVDTLKRENLDKDAMIKELKFQMHKSVVEEERKQQSSKQYNEINRLRQQLGCSPRNNMQHLQKGFKSFDNLHSHPHQQAQNVLQNFNPNNYLSSKQIINKQQNYQTSKNNNFTAFQSLSDYELRITVLQNQLRQYQLQVFKQKQQITRLQQETRWQQKFILSFVKMCDQLSLNYGEKLKLNKLGNDLKKKTKLSWNYLKNIVAYFIQCVDGNEGNNSKEREEI